MSNDKLVLGDKTVTIDTDYPEFPIRQYKVELFIPNDHHLLEWLALVNEAYNNLNVYGNHTIQHVLINDGYYKLNGITLITTVSNDNIHGVNYFVNTQNSYDTLIKINASFKLVN